jgi:choline dehydrogenase-like flavoprotein
MDYDVIIIGAGTTGAVIGYELGMHGHQVLLLEAGGTSGYRFPIRIAKDGEIPFKPAPRFNYRRMTTFYNRYKGGFGLGGHGQIYAGWTYRFLPDDFRMKSRFGLGSDWPIRYEDLMPYYRKTEKLMGISGEAHPLFPGTEDAYPNPPFPVSYATKVFNRKFKDFFEYTTAPQSRNRKNYDGRMRCAGYRNCIHCPIEAKWTPQNTPIRKSHDLPNIEYFIRSPALFMEAAPDKKIGHLVCQTGTGEVKLQARQYVLAANGIDTPRLLLNAKQPHAKDGLANSSGLVGKCYMVHPHVHWRIDLGEIVFGGRGPLHSSNCLKYVNHAMRDKTAAFNMHYLGDELPDITFNPDLWGEDLIRDIQASAGRMVDVGICIEMEPHEQNRVLLDKSTDPLGLRNAVVQCHVTEYAQAGYNLFKNEMKRAIKAAGIKKYIRKDRILSDGGHWMGTTRMGSHPRDSVTDSYGRCWDHPNLFIAGASLFPTSTPFNPIQTSIALALRTSDEIHQTLMKNKL